MKAHQLQADKPSIQNINRGNEMNKIDYTEFAA